jgi:hypothetical protein
MKAQKLKMKIADASRLKSMIEFRIAQMLEDYQNETGIYVDGIEVKKIDYQNLAAKRKAYQGIDVKINAPIENVIY